MAGSGIPTPEQFEAASRHMEHISRGTSHVANEATQWLASLWAMFRVHVIAERQDSVRVYAFFAENSGLSAFLGSASREGFEEFVTKALQVARQVSADRLSVHFEYDAAENIDTHHNGDYYRRMR